MAILVLLPHSAWGLHPYSLCQAPAFLHLSRKTRWFSLPADCLSAMALSPMCLGAGVGRAKDSTYERKAEEKLGGLLRFVNMTDYFIGSPRWQQGKPPDHYGSESCRNPNLGALTGLYLLILALESVVPMLYHLRKVCVSGDQNEIEAINCQSSLAARITLRSLHKGGSKTMFYFCYGDFLKQTALLMQNPIMQIFTCLKPYWLTL